MSLNSPPEKRPGFFELIGLLFSKRKSQAFQTQSNSSHRIAPKGTSISRAESAELNKQGLKRKETAISLGGIIIGAVFFPSSVLCFYAMIQARATLLWWQFLVGIPAGSILGVISLVAIWYLISSIRNRWLLGRDHITTQAKVLARWEVRGGSGDYDLSDEYFVKFTFSPTDVKHFVGSLEVIASISYGVYKNARENEMLKIQYAREDPLVIKLEGEMFLT